MQVRITLYFAAKSFLHPPNFTEIWAIYPFEVLECSLAKLPLQPFIFHLNFVLLSPRVNNLDKFMVTRDCLEPSSHRIASNSIHLWPFVYVFLEGFRTRPSLSTSHFRWKRLTEKHPSIHSFCSYRIKWYYGKYDQTRKLRRRNGTPYSFQISHRHIDAENWCTDTVLTAGWSRDMSLKSGKGSNIPVGMLQAFDNHMHLTTLDPDSHLVTLCFWPFLRKLSIFHGISPPCRFQSSSRYSMRFPRLSFQKMSLCSDTI